MARDSPLEEVCVHTTFHRPRDHPRGLFWTLNPPPSRRRRSRRSREIHAKSCDLITLTQRALGHQWIPNSSWRTCFGANRESWELLVAWVFWSFPAARENKFWCVFDASSVAIVTICLADLLLLPFQVHSWLSVNILIFSKWDLFSNLIERIKSLILKC